MHILIYVHFIRYTCVHVVFRTFKPKTIVGKETLKVIHFVTMLNVSDEIFWCHSISFFCEFFCDVYYVNFLFELETFLKKNQFEC